MGCFWLTSKKCMKCQKSEGWVGDFSFCAKFHFSDHGVYTFQTLPWIVASPKVRHFNTRSSLNNPHTPHTSHPYLNSPSSTTIKFFLLDVRGYEARNALEKRRQVSLQELTKVRLFLHDIETRGYGISNIMSKHEPAKEYTKSKMIFCRFSRFHISGDVWLFKR